MRKILLSLTVIGLTVMVVFNSSNAFFSDTETSTNNILQAGDIDLTINGDDNPEAIVFFEDLKPGDNYIEEKIVRVGSNPAWVWMHIYDVDTEQGVQTEPEDVEENGNPKHDINNYLTYDLEVDGEVLISQEDEISFNDMVSCWVPLGELPGGVDVSVNQSFHFDEDVTNWAQGDRMNFSEEFAAVQSRNNPDPLPPPSETGRVWDTELGHCVDEDPILWQIGDIEDSDLDPPQDELNWPGAFGNFPAFTDPYPIPPNNFDEFPWNSNFGAGYATDFDVTFSYGGGSPINVKLSVGWSPGRSGTEQKQVFLDGGLVPVLDTGDVVGVSTPGWYENMPRRVDTDEFVLSPGAHTLNFKHLKGDGTLWDFVKLEKI